LSDSTSRSFNDLIGNAIALALNLRLKGAFLRECESGKRYAIGGLGDLYFYAWDVGGVNLGGTEDRVLGEYFRIDLGDEVVFAARVLTPDLPEFDVLDGHVEFRVLSGLGRVNCLQVTLGRGIALCEQVERGGTATRLALIPCAEEITHATRNNAATTEPKWTAG